MDDRAGRSGKGDSLRKVVVVTTRHGAQDDRIYFKEALSLAERYRVLVVAPDDGGDLNWEGGVEYRSIRRRRGLFGRLLSVMEAVVTVRKEDPDYCHLHDLDLILAVPILKLITRAKVIFDSHEAYPEAILMKEGIPRGLRTPLSRLLDVVEKWLVGLGDCVITADEPTRESFQRTGLLTATVFNYPPLSIFETDPQLLEKERKGYEGRIPIVYQGSMGRERGLFHMLESLEILREREPRILLRLVGLNNQKLEEEVAIIEREKGLSDNLEIVSWLPHRKMAYVMKSSVLGLIPWQPVEKHKKNIPIKLFEYMACGLAVVAAQLPSIEEYMGRVKVGEMYDSTNSKDLAETVLRLLSDEESLTEMGENGQRAVREAWNWKKMERVLWKVYQELGKDNGACV